MGEKIVTKEFAISKISDLMTIMIGGFIDLGRPDSIIKALSNCDISGIHLISNDMGTTGSALSLLIRSGVIKSATISHCGLNEIATKYLGDCNIKFVPQGDLVEGIRCAGIGAVAIVFKGYQVESISADVSIIRASRGDIHGNLVYDGMSQNFNHVMAMAGKYTIAEIDELSILNPNEVMTPGIFVDAITIRE